MEKTPAEHREDADAKEAGQEQYYYEQLQADPHYQEDVRNQQIADSYEEDSPSSEGFYDGFAEDKHQFEHDFWR